MSREKKLKLTCPSTGQSPCNACSGFILSRIHLARNSTVSNENIRKSLSSKDEIWHQRIKNKRTILVSHVLFRNRACSVFSLQAANTLHGKHGYFRLLLQQTALAIPSEVLAPRWDGLSLFPKGSRNTVHSHCH